MSQSKSPTIAWHLLVIQLIAGLGWTFLIFEGWTLLFYQYSLLNWRYIILIALFTFIASFVGSSHEF